MNDLEAFLLDLKADARKKKILSLGDNVLDLYIESSKKSGGGKDWLEIEPANEDHIKILNGLGDFSKSTDVRISSPTSIREVGSEIWIANSYRNLLRFSKKGTYLGEKFFSTKNVNLSINSFDVGKDTIIVATGYNNKITAFTLDASNKWELDVASIAKDVAIVSATSALVAAGSDIIEVDMSGEIIETKLSSVFASRIKIINGYLYTTSTQDKLIRVYEIESYKLIETYALPGSASPRAISLSADKSTLCVLSDEKSAGVVGIDVKTHDVVFTTSYPSFGRKIQEYEYAGFSDILALADNKLLVANQYGNRLLILPAFSEYPIEYPCTISPDYRIAHAPTGYDAQTQTIATKIDDLDKADKEYLLLELKK